MVKLISALILTLGATSLPSGSTAETTRHLIEVKLNGHWGVVDQNDVTIVPLDYDSVYVRSDGIVSATKDRIETYFDEKGHVIWQGLHGVGYVDSNGYLTFEGSNNLIGLMNRDGNQILPPVFGYIHPFDSSMNYVVHRRGMASVINLAGKQLFPQTFFYISQLGKTGFAIAKPDRDSYGIIDRTGAWVIDPGRFEEVGEFGDNGLAPAKLGAKWGFIDSAGNWVILPISEDMLSIKPFNQVGTTAVKIDGKWGFINRHGKIVVKPQFDEIRRPKNGVYLVRIGKRSALIDGRGRYLFRSHFDGFSEFEAEGLAVAWQGEHTFIINRKGHRMFGNRFEQVVGFSGDGWAAAQSGGKWGAIDTRGAWILKPKYQCVSFCFDELPPPIEIREIPPEG